MQSIDDNLKGRTGSVAPLPVCKEEVVQLEELTD